MRDDEKIERELRFHLDQRTADLVAAGLDPDASRRQARLEFGGLTQTRTRVTTSAVMVCGTASRRMSGTRCESSARRQVSPWWR